MTNGHLKFGFRDRVRRFLLRNDQSSPAQTAIPPAQAGPSSNGLSSDMCQPLQLNRSILEETLLELSPEEQATIRRKSPDSKSDIDVDVAVRETHARTRDLQDACKDRSWQWSYRGREVCLRDEADKVLRFLDTFKSVGDVVANADPIHVGLPWAGIRIILEMALSRSRQRAALLTGTDLALYFANRLQLYVDYHENIRSLLISQSNREDLMKNFRRDLVQMYALVLRFLASAIQTYEAGLTYPMFRALWEPSDLENFENKCNELSSRLETAASMCNRELSTDDRLSGKQWKDELVKKLRSLDELNDIKGSLDVLKDKIDLSKLQDNAVKGAVYNSYEDQGYPTCLNGTRTEILRHIAHWSDTSDSKCIFWLCGKAGTGKSTISRTVATTLDQQGRLGASFFFKKNEGDRGNAKRLFPTLAIQLADKIPDFSHLIAAALDEDSILCARSLNQQSEKLLLKPLECVVRGPSSPTDIVIVIDALDECDREDDVKVILTLLSRLQYISTVQMRVFVTSRPELPIKFGFQTMGSHLHHDIEMEEVQATTIEHDIRVYLCHEFKKMVAERLIRRPHHALPLDWPGKDNIQALVKLSVPLFIFAATIYRFISDHDSERRLTAILEHKNNMSYTSLISTYLPILQQLFLRQEEEDSRMAIREFQEVVGPIVLVATPLSVLSLSNLLELDSNHVDERLEQLHSVLHIPSSQHLPVRLLHLSFRDFLIDAQTRDKNPFWVDETKTHGVLFHQCLKLLNRPGTMREDICNAKRPGTRRADVIKQQVAYHIPADVDYACCYWVWHLEQSAMRISDDDQVHRFLKTHFLHWMEALSWLGRLSSIVEYISTLQSLVHPEKGVGVLSFLDDASRFVLRNRYIVDLAPLQLYLSALIFTPRLSIVKQAFMEVLEKNSARWLHCLPNVPARWSHEKQKLEGHDGFINCVAFSPDGQSVASASSDKTVRLWDTKTGEQMQKIEGHDDVVNCVAFSPNGQVVASGSDDMTIRLWNTKTIEQLQNLDGHYHKVKSVAFSPNGQVVASGSEDATARLWDMETGKELWKLEGHDGCVNCVAFSPNGQVVASGSKDMTIRLWETKTGQLVLKIEGHDDSIRSIVFSPNGEVVASGSEDTTVRLWDAKTGEESWKLEGHVDSVSSVAFSPNGQALASASEDRTAKLWDAKIGKEIKKLEGHDYWVNTVAFSPDNRVLASGSNDWTVRLWDADIREEIRTQKLEGHNGYVSSVIISPDGQVVASGSYDKTVKLWDITGKQAQKIEGFDTFVRFIVFSPDSQLIALGSKDTLVRLWDITGRQVQEFEGHDSYVNCVAFSPNGQVVASGSDDKTVRLWNIKGEQVQKLDGHDGAVRSVTFSPDGQVVASGSDDKTVRLWNIKGEQVQKLEGHEEPVNSVAFSPDSRVLAAATSDNALHPWLSESTVRLWDAKAGEEIASFPIGLSEVRELSFTKDGYLKIAIGLFINTTERYVDVAAYASSSSHTDDRQEWIDVVPDRQWIGYGNEQLLWLPHEYRGISSAVHDEVLVIGQRFGPVSFFGFNKSSESM